MRIFQALKQDSEARGHFAVLALVVLATVVAAVHPALITGLSLTCTLRRFTGIRCPFCGMTTDFISMAHGHWPHENPFSIPFAILIYLVYPTFLFYTIRTGQLFLFSGRRLQIAAMSIGCVMWAANNLGK